MMMIRQPRPAPLVCDVATYIPYRYQVDVASCYIVPGILYLYKNMIPNLRVNIN